MSLAKISVDSIGIELDITVNQQHCFVQDIWVGYKNGEILVLPILQFYFHAWRQTHV